MALVIADRVKETSTTTGTGTLTLGGAETGYQTFSSAIGNGNTCYYAITLDSAWEVGIGTVGAGTLARTTVLQSSNSDALVDFAAGTKSVFVTYPADKAVYKDAAGDVVGLKIGVDVQAYDADLTTWGGKTAPTGTVVGTTDTQTLTGKTIAYADNTLTGVQPTLVSGTSIKTVNSTSVLGSGNIAVQETLVSGTNIKTVNSTSLLGSGNVAVGDVTGPASSVSGNIATFSGTTGKIVQDGGKALPTGTIVGTSDSQTLTSKTISVDDNTISGIAASSFVLSNSSGNIDGAAAQKVIPTGVVVGDTDTQTLTNKTISGASNTITVDGTNGVGYLNIPQNSESAAYTLVLADAGQHILHPSADTTARTFTIPANSSVAFPIGTAVTFINQNGAGTVTISITTDTMRLAGAGTTGSRTLAANGVATAIKVTSTEWIISGTGLT